MNSAELAQETIGKIPMARYRARLYQLSERAGNRAEAMREVAHALSLKGDIFGQGEYLGKSWHHLRRAVKLAAAYYNAAAASDDSPSAGAVGGRTVAESKL